LNGLRGSLGVRDLLTHGCFPRLPDLQYGFLEQRM
jgi:hypothetical protein